MNQYHETVFETLKAMPGANRYELSHRIGNTSPGEVENALFNLRRAGLARVEESAFDLFGNWYEISVPQVKRRHFATLTTP